MNRKKEILVQIAAYLLMLAFCILYSASTEQHGLSFEGIKEELKRVFVIGWGLEETLFLPLFILIAYNFSAGLIWCCYRLFKHRKNLKFFHIIAYPNSIIILFSLTFLGVMVATSQLKNKHKEKLIHDIFASGSSPDVSGYKVLREEELNDEMFETPIVDIAFYEKHALVEFENGRTIIAIFNDTRKYVALEKMW